jgi:hypothetical protein
LVKGSLDAAKEMNSRREEGIERMNKELPRPEARQKRLLKRSEVKDWKSRKSPSGAETSAAGMLQKAREELKVKGKSPAGTKADVERFADEIVRKLVSA